MQTQNKFFHFSSPNSYSLNYIDLPRHKKFMNVPRNEMKSGGYIITIITSLKAFVGYILSSMIDIMNRS